MKKWIFVLPIVLLVLVACGPTVEPENEEGVAVASTEPPLAEVATELPPTTVSSSPTAVSEPPTAVPTDVPPTEPTAIPTDQPVIEPPVPTEEPALETAVIAGRIDEGAFFLGAPNAPVTMIDYSDFL